MRSYRKSLITQYLSENLIYNKKKLPLKEKHAQIISLENSAKLRHVTNTSLIKILSEEHSSS